MKKTLIVQVRHLSVSYLLVVLRLFRDLLFQCQDQVLVLDREPVREPKHPALMPTGCLHRWLNLPRPENHQGAMC